MMQELAMETRRPLVLLSLCTARARAQSSELEALNLNFGLLATSILALEVEQLQGSMVRIRCNVPFTQLKANTPLFLNETMPLHKDKGDVRPAWRFGSVFLSTDVE